PFSHVLDARSYHEQPFEVLVSHTCSHFRQIALATPRLWTSFYIHENCTDKSIAPYIKRSGACLVDIRVDLTVHKLQMDETRLNATLQMILPLSNRWRSLSIAYDRENVRYPLISKLCNQPAQALQHLSITVDDVDSADASIVNRDITFPHIFKEGTPTLEFVRLRGLAIHLFRPQLCNVVTLHLDQTTSIPVLYSTFRDIVTCSRVLANLSLYGDIIGVAQWPSGANPIHLPALRSLRICGVAGETYTGILLGIHAPELNSLTLKDVHAHDLDLLWEVMDVSRYTNLNSLIFCDFELPISTYAHIFKTFKEVITFTSLHSSAGESILVDLLLGGAVSAPTGSHVPWPKLQILSFPFDAYSDEDELIEDIVEVRRGCGYPLSKIVLGQTEMVSEGIRIKVGNIRVEFCWRTEVWPTNGTQFDHDDSLFP
ncbi:hypothetical protein BYT27DRAFT_7083509, partial [Phlegmacium glaucopus]